MYGSVVQWEKRAFINNLGAVATRGIAREMVERVLSKGDSDGLWDTPPGCPEMRDGEEWLNIEAIKLTLVEMCREAGVTILLHTNAVEVIVEGARQSGAQDPLPRLAGVVFENKSGRFALRGKVVVDATADLDLVWRAVGEQGCGLRPPAERIGCDFYIWFDGIDNQRYVEYVLENPKAHGYPDPAKYPDKLRRHMAEEKLIILHGMEDILEAAKTKGLMEPVKAATGGLQVPYKISIHMKNVGHGRRSGRQREGSTEKREPGATAEDAQRG